MLNSIDFAQCIRDNLKGRRYEHKRIDEILKAFDARVEYHKSTGLADMEANIVAMKDTFDNMTLEATERAKRTSKMLSVAIENNERIAQAPDVKTSMFLLDGKKGSKGVALARAAASVIEDDPRFKGVSYSSRKDNYRGQLYAIFGDVLEKIGKGAFGRQKGTAHLPNIIREVFGEDTGDASAKEFSRAWLKVSDLMPDLVNNAGGSMRRLDRYIPQSQNAARMLNRKAEWIDDHMNGLDWGRMRWPDGTLIETADREAMLGKVYDTLSTDGAIKIDETAFRGNGRAVGNSLNQHRFLHYKDAASWLNVHEKYGDGSVFDVFVRHVESMAHRIALIDTFGPNPEMGFDNLALSVRKAAAELSPRDQADAEGVLKNVVEPMFDLVMRDNPMDPNSGLGNLVIATGNILTSAQLASASFLAIPGDFMQTAAVRALNGMDLFGGVDYYVRAIANDPEMANMSTQAGFIMDEIVSSTYATTRYTGLATHGPSVTRRIADVAMRASLLSGHTRAARWATQAEFMGLLARSRGKAFADLPFSRVMERYGISPEDWDAFRTRVKIHNPKDGVSFLRPIDILASDIPNAQKMYQNFQGMIFEESRKMVPETTIEATVGLKNTSRPDTLAGAILHSFAMYKNFPMSFMMIYGRLGMTSPHALGRLGFYAGLGAGMTMVGALGTQLREISKGRDPLPMDNAAFMGKAFLSGGALSIWGDFLFAGVNQYGGGPQDVIGGPIAGFAGDTTQLLFGDVFQWANTIGTLNDKEFKGTTAAKAVEYARRYTPGSNLWWARLALERQVFDRLQEIADPNAYRKRQQQMRKQKETYGNGYWFAPGERVPSRAPSFGG